MQSDPPPPPDPTVGSAASESSDAQQKTRPEKSSGHGMIENAGRIFGLSFLLAQGLVVILATHSADAPASIIPLDSQTSYQLYVTVDGRSLTRDETQKRYRLTTRDLTSLTPEGLRKIIRDCERSYYKNEPAYVRLHTQYNGGSKETWLWPES
jgi:hypothetical protein